MPKPTKWILPFAVVAAAILGWILASNGVNLTKQGAGTARNLATVRKLLDMCGVSA